MNLPVCCILRAMQGGSPQLIMMCKSCALITVWMLFSVKLAATLHSPASGRYMDLSTNMPGLQFYSGNNLNGSVGGKGAYPYPIYGGLALETQVSSVMQIFSFPGKQPEPCRPSEEWRLRKCAVG